MPEMIFVDSSNIEAIGYDAANRELHVRFVNSGETYVYSDVEEWEFEEFQRADSKGTYLYGNIRPRHNYHKL
jgi:hypothetical protein